VTGQSGTSISAETGAEKCSDLTPRHYLYRDLDRSPQSRARRVLDSPRLVLPQQRDCPASLALSRPLKRYLINMAGSPTKGGWPRGGVANPPRSRFSESLKWVMEESGTGDSRLRWQLSAKRLGTHPGRFVFHPSSSDPDFFGNPKAGRTFCLYPPRGDRHPPPSPPTPQSPGPKGLGLFLWRHDVEAHPSFWAHWPSRTVIPDLIRDP